MKKLQLTPFLLLIIPLIFTSCSKDDNTEEDPPPVQGEFTIDDVEYALHYGSISYWGEVDDNVHLFGIMLHSSGIYVEWNEGYVGQGDAVGFFLLSENRDLPDPGSYSIIPEEDDWLAGSAFGVTMYIDYGPGVGGDEGQQYLCTEGEVLFDKDDIEYEFTINTVADKINPSTGNITEEDIDISVNFKGTILEALATEE